MKLSYKEPEIQIRKYDFPSDGIFTTSQLEPTTGLDPDDYPLFG